MKVKRLKNGRYQARWRDKDGIQRARNFLYNPTMEELAALERDPTAPERKLTFREFAEGTWFKQAALTRTTSTLLEDKKCVERHLFPLFGDRPLEELRRKDLESARLALSGKLTRLKRPFEPKTVNMLLALAKQIMQTAFEHELVPGNPWTNVDPLPVQKKVQAFWTFEEKARFLAWCRAHDRPFADLVFVALETGLRKGELKALRIGDLDFDRRRICVKGTFNERVKVRYDRTKNGQVDDFVPMTQAVYDLLKPLEDGAPSQPVFSPRLFSDALDRLKRRAKAAGVKPIRFHDLRHTFGSHLGMQGVNAHMIKALMRHATLDMTDRYVKLAPTTLSQAIEKVSAAALHFETAQAD